MLSYGLSLVVLVVSLIACSAPPLPTLEVPRTATSASAAVSDPTAAVKEAIAAPAIIAATAPRYGCRFRNAPDYGYADGNADIDDNTHSHHDEHTDRDASSNRNTYTLSGNAHCNCRRVPDLHSDREQPGSRISDDDGRDYSHGCSARYNAAQNHSDAPNLAPTSHSARRQCPPVPAQILGGQRITAFYVGPDGSVYYGVAPSDESLQFPANTVFQLWKWTPGSEPFAITPTMHMIGGVLVHNSEIYFNELGTLRRMPDNGNVSQGEIVIRYPTYENNRNLPYGHMNNGLAVYNLNGQEVLLMSMGSVLDSSFPGAGVPANIAEPYYEDFPTGRINYATFDWLDQQHEYVASTRRRRTVRRVCTRRSQSVESHRGERQRADTHLCRRQRPRFHTRKV